MTKTVVEFVTDTVSVFGYPGIAFLMALESACLPIPSEVVMPLAGYLASIGQFNFLVAVTVGALGCSLGSAVAYSIGAIGGRATVERWGKYFWLTKARLNRFESYFERFGGITVFAARVLPMVPAFISFPAGIGKMQFWRFLIYTFSGTWIWCCALAGLGFEFGKSWASSVLVNRMAERLEEGLFYFVAVVLIWLTWRAWHETENDN